MRKMHAQKALKYSNVNFPLNIYFIIQFRQHNIKVTVTATCFDLTSDLQAYLRNKTNYNKPVHIWDPRWLTCVGIRI